MATITSGLPSSTMASRLTTLHGEDEDRPSSTSVVATLRHSPRLLLRKSAALKEPAQSPDIFARGPGPALRASTRLQTRNTSARLLNARSKKATRQQQQQEQQQQQQQQQHQEFQGQNETMYTIEENDITKITTPSDNIPNISTTTTTITTSTDMTDSPVQTRSSRAAGLLSTSSANPSLTPTTTTAAEEGTGSERRSRIATRSTSQTREPTRSRTKTRSRAHARTIPSKTTPGDDEDKSDEDDEDGEGLKSYLLRNRRHHRRPRSVQKTTEPDNTSTLSNLTLTPRLTRLGARHESGLDMDDDLAAHRNRHLRHVEDEKPRERSSSHGRRSRSATSSSSQDSHAKAKNNTTSGVPSEPRKPKKKTAIDAHKVPSLPTRRRLRARTTKVAKMGIDEGGDDDEEEDEEDEEEDEDEDEEVDYDNYARSDVDEEMMDVDQPTSQNMKQHRRVDEISGSNTPDTLDGFIASKPETSITNISTSALNNSMNANPLYQLHAKRKVEDEDMEDQVATMSMDEGQVVSTKLARIDETSDSADKAYLKTFYSILKSPRGDEDDGILSSESEDADLESEDDDDDFEEIDVWEFIATLPPLGPLPSNFVFTMPERTDNTPPITLVLDIDETLVHCATRPLESPDIIFPVEYNHETWEVYGRIRPGMLEFLEKMSEKFEVITFTASQECYAEALLKIIDPEKKFIKHRYYRDSCVPVFGNYVKDLRILNRDLSRVVIIDNSPQAFGYQISNGIPIESWYDDKSDRELAKVMTFLETLQGVEDVRPKIDEQYKLQERIQRVMTQASHQQISMGGLGGLGATLTSTSTLLPSGGVGGNGDTSSSCSTSGTNSLASLQSIVPDNSDMDATMMLFEVEKAEEDFVLQALTNGKVESTRTTATRSSSSTTTTTTTTTHTMTMTTRSNSLDATHNLAKISL